MKYTLTPNQFYPEVYDLTVYVDSLPEVTMDPIHHEGDTTYWYGENTDGFVRFGISHNRRVFNHEPGYMWSSRSSVFNGKFSSKCFCKEVTLVVNENGREYRYGCFAMTAPAIMTLLGDGYELFGLVKDCEYNVEIGEEYQILTDEIIQGLGECIESFICGEVRV